MFSLVTANADLENRRVQLQADLMKAQWLAEENQRLAAKEAELRTLAEAQLVTIRLEAEKKKQHVIQETETRGQLEAKLTQANSQLVEAKQLIKESQKRLQQEAQAKEQLQTRLTQLESQLAQSVQENQNKITQGAQANDALQARLVEIENQLAQAQLLAQEQQGKAAQETQVRDQIEAELNQVKARLIQTQKLIDSYQNQAAQEAEAKKQLETKLTETASRLTQAEEWVEAHKKLEASRIANAKKNLESIRLRRKKAEDEIGVQLFEMIEANARLEKFKLDSEGQISELRNVIQEAHKALSQIYLESYPEVQKQLRQAEADSKSPEAQRKNDLPNTINTSLTLTKSLATKVYAIQLGLKPFLPDPNLLLTTKQIALFDNIFQETEIIALTQNHLDESIYNLDELAKLQNQLTSQKNMLEKATITLTEIKGSKSPDIEKCKQIQKDIESLNQYIELLRANLNQAKVTEIELIKCCKAIERIKNKESYATLISLISTNLKLLDEERTVCYECIKAIHPGYVRLKSDLLEMLFYIT